MAGFCSSVWVASTCSTSDVPMPNASAPNGAVGGGVAVTADDGGAGEGNALFRADDVDDALPRVEQRDVGHAELGDVGL